MRIIDRISFIESFINFLSKCLENNARYHLSLVTRRFAARYLSSTLWDCRVSVCMCVCEWFRFFFFFFSFLSFLSSFIFFRASCRWIFAHSWLSQFLAAHFFSFHPSKAVMCVGLRITSRANNLAVSLLPRSVVTLSLFLSLSFLE